MPIRTSRRTAPSRAFFVMLNKLGIQTFHALPLLSLPPGYIAVPVINHYDGPLTVIGPTPGTPNYPRFESPSTSPPPPLLGNVPKEAEILSDRRRPIPRDTDAPRPSSTSHATSSIATVQEEQLQQIAAQLASLNDNVARLTKSLLALSSFPPSKKH